MMAVGECVVVWQPDEEAATCLVCRKNFVERTSSSSCHHFCGECILAISSGAIFCPVCRREAIVESNVDAKKIPEKGSATLCAACSDSLTNADAYCRQCFQSMCFRCIENHKMETQFEGHKLISIEDLEATNLSNFDSENCSVHHEPLIIYCFDCHCLACHLCIVNEHSSHKYDFCAGIGPSMKADIEECMVPLKLIGSKINDAVADQRIIEKELESNSKSVYLEVETVFKYLHEVIDDCKQEFLDVMKIKVETKISAVHKELINLSEASKEIQSIVAYTKQCVGICSSNEIVYLHTQLKNRIQKELEKCRESCIRMSKESIELVGMETKRIGEFEELCKNLVTLTAPSIDPEKCVVCDLDASNVEVGKECKAVLGINLCDGRPTKCRAQVDSYLTCQHNNSIADCTIKRTESGRCHVGFTPKVRGLHVLYVSVNGKEIPESPFPVFVNFPPSHLCDSVNILRDCVSNPTSIAVNSMGELVVAEYEGDVVVLDKAGKELRRLRRKNHGFQELSGMAVDAEDNIYFVDMATNRIYKSDSSCSNVLKKRIKQVNGPGHCGVAVVKEEIMVCEGHNDGSIMVYKQDLTYCRRITSTGMGLFLDVAADSHGNLYVVGNTNSCIQVLDLDGTFLRSVGCGGSDPCRLNCPRNVCVVRDYLYVSDWVDASVSIFTIEGDYVSSFGSCGEPSSNGPRSLCIDTNGFIYLCDLNISTIEIY